MNVFQAPGNRAEKFIDTVDAASLPDPSTLNNGDYYIIQTGGTLWGKTWANGDRAISDGTAYSQDADATKQVAEGGTGATTAAGARTNLGVNGIDQNAAALVQALRKPLCVFDGAASYFTIADSAKLSFTSGQDDQRIALLWEGILTDPADFAFVGKFGTAVSLREWVLYTDANKRLVFAVRDTSGNSVDILSDIDLTAFSGRPVSIGAVYDGAGPNFANAFASAANGMRLYLNNQLLTVTKTNNASYNGMSDTSQDMWIGRYSTVYGKGEFTRCVIVNDNLSAEQLLKLQNGSLDAEYAVGGSLGQLYTQTTSAGADGWTAYQGTADGNVDSIGGRDNVLRLTLDTASGQHFLQRTITGMQVGQKVRAHGWTYIPSTNSHLDTLRISRAGADVVVDITTLDAWVYFVETFVMSSAGATMYVEARDGGVASFQDSGGNDVLYVDGLTLTPVGVVFDVTSDNFDADIGKAYDTSVNGFVAVSNSVSLIGPKKPVYKTNQFTPGLTFGGANTGMTIASSEGYLTRDGNLCHIEGMITLSAKGSATGSAVITGLEFLGPNLSGNNIPVTFGRCANMANLTSPIIGNIVDNSNTIALQDVGANGSVDLDETNFTDTTVITFSATYRIQ